MINLIKIMKSSHYEDYFYLSEIFKSTNLKFLAYKYDEALNMYNNMIKNYSKKIGIGCVENSVKFLFKDISTLIHPADFHNELRNIYQHYYQTESMYKNMLNFKLNNILTMVKYKAEQDAANDEKIMISIIDNKINAKIITDN